MNNIEDKVIDYFRPPERYFWRWTEKMEVVEWPNGMTICFRDDLTGILKDLARQGLPPFGTILLILFACNSRDRMNSGKFFLNEIFQLLISAKEFPDPEKLEATLTSALKMLYIIHSLPIRFRTGKSRVHLIAELTRNFNPALDAPESRQVILEFESGRCDPLIQKTGETPLSPAFKKDLEILSQAYASLNDPKTLELKLLTGIETLPEPLEIELPEIPDADLLEQLEQDDRTFNLAGLTRRLVAAINFPMHPRGVSDLNYGGVADITNRGDLDRLLPSELAADDLVLTARLINNEALYFRKEEPPSNEIRKRTVLVDTTIKMWGIPRVFAISAALACNRKANTKLETEVYALKKKDYKKMDLSSKEGVIQALEIVDPGLHCGEVMLEFPGFQSKAENEELVFITSDESMETPIFQKAFSEVRSQLSYLILVGREGDLQFYQMLNGGRRLLSNFRFDLQSLPWNRKIKEQGVTDPGDRPAFLDADPAPLFFPTARVILNRERLFRLENMGIIGITKMQRVLFWPHENSAMEIFPFIEEGEYTFGGDGKRYFYILVAGSHRKGVKLYKFDIQEYTVGIMDFSGLINEPVKSRFTEKYFYINTPEKDYKISTLSGSIEETKNIDKGMDLPVSVVFHGGKPEFKKIRKYINNGYSILNNINRVYINEAGRIALDHREVRLINPSQCIKIVNAKKTECLEESSEDTNWKLEPAINPLLHFRKFVWRDGSEAVIDPRGFLHLRSSDTRLPEITITLIIDKSVACWASNGHVSGSTYFTKIAPGNRFQLTNDRRAVQWIPVEAFYSSVIRHFIDRIVQMGKQAKADGDNRK